MRTSPLVARSRPAICLSRTLFPEPLGPMMQKISPGLISRLMSRSTVERPKVLVRFLTVTPKVLSTNGEVVKARLMGSEEGFGDEVIEHQDQDEGGDDGLGHRGADLARAAAGVETGVAAHEHDHEAEDLGLEQAVDDVLPLHEILERGE